MTRAELSLEPGDSRLAPFDAIALSHAGKHEPEHGACAMGLGCIHAEHRDGEVVSATCELAGPRELSASLEHLRGEGREPQLGPVRERCARQRGARVAVPDVRGLAVAPGRTQPHRITRGEHRRRFVAAAQGGPVHLFRERRGGVHVTLDESRARIRERDGAVELDCDSRGHAGLVRRRVVGDVGGTERHREKSAATSPTIARDVRDWAALGRARGHRAARSSWAIARVHRFASHVGARARCAAKHRPDPTPPPVPRRTRRRSRARPRRRPAPARAPCSAECRRWCRGP